MSIMDMFRFGGSAPAAQAPATAPASAPTGTAPAGTTQQATTTPPATTEPAAAPDPLESFKDLWTPPKEGEPQPANFNPADMFQIDPAKIQQSVSQMNFASTITPEVLQQITAGGEDAAKAFLVAMNGVAQQAFAQSMIGSAKLVEQALTKANDSLDARMQEGIRKQQVSSSLVEANPALAHPAAKPIVAALEAQFTSKYPTASPAEITKLAQDYLSKFASLASPAQKTDTAPASAADTDWEKFFS